MKIIAGMVLLVAGYTDLKYRKIPNELTWPFILSGLAINIGIGNFKMALTGFAVAFCLGLLMLVTGGIGGGDIKLMAGIGAWLGTTAYFNILFVASVIGVSFYAIWAIKNRVLKERSLDLYNKMLLLKVTGRTIIKEEGEKNRIAFGACLAIAGILYVLTGGVYYQPF